MARNQANIRQPWQDELNRLRWLETRLLDLLDDWSETAGEVHVKADDHAGETLAGGGLTSWDASRSAAIMQERCTAEVMGLIQASHAGADPADELHWATWHLAQLSRNLDAFMAVRKNGAGQ
jgi:hypothetical protein